MNAGQLLSKRRLTIVHSFYSANSISGENLAVELQTAALIEAGATIDVSFRSTDEMSEFKTYKLQSWIRVATGIDVGGPGLPKCENENHVLIIHNLFPNYGLRAFLDWPGPVVVILHNFRTVCSNGLLLRDGKVCTKCIESTSLQSFKHACYRSSRLATLPLTIATWKGATRNPLLARADRIVTQSERSTNVLLGAGVDPAKLTYVPGFVESSTHESGAKLREEWIFAGRLSSEKGLTDLLMEWPRSAKLDVVGDGPDLPQLRRTAPDNVRFLGAQSREWILENIASYRGLVFPGICPEGAHPMVIREALSRGVPVLAAEGSSAADLIDQHGGGLTFDLGAKQLDEKLNLISNSRELYSTQASSVYKSHFKKEDWVSKMTGVLNAAAAHRTSQSHI